MTITPGKYVSIAYDLYQVNLDGSETKVADFDASHPEAIIYGVTEGVLRPLEAVLDGKEQGDRFDITVKAEEAFGPYDKDQVVELDRDIFVVDGKFDADVVKVGNYVPMMTQQGYRVNGKVLSVGDDKVTLDFNHPLAGKDVRFAGQIIEVRDATPEELHPATGGCGCHCGDEHCGDDHCHDGGGDCCCH